MRSSWRQTFRRLAAGCIVYTSVAMSSAMCYALSAYDDASDPVYADGWQAGDNGGFGFGAWNFDSRHCSSHGVCDVSYTKPGIKFIDDGQQLGTHYSNPFNNIGAPATGSPPNTRTLGLGTTPDSDGLNTVGRSFPALQPGQTLSVVVDNPTDEQFFKGYFIRLNSVQPGFGGNICYAGSACSPGANPVNKFSWWRFEYFNDGVWKAGDNGAVGDPPGNRDLVTTLFDTDTAAAGMRLDFTLTAVDTYTMTVTPLANPGQAYTQSGMLRNPGTPVDYLEFVFFNTTTDTATPPTRASDFYIRRMQISGAGVPGDYNGNGVVDAADYVLWRKGGPLQNEVDTPGTVNAADYIEWRKRFGNTSGSGSSILGSSVPEPVTLVYLVGAMGVLTVMPRRKPLR